jgi:DNA repair exonuclease SbcCD ATPase subunit
MIKFKKLEGEGFGSFISKTSFCLDTIGLKIFRGPVGAGKTSVPSLLYWVLYGITLKKGSTIQTWDHKKSDKFQGTFGKVTFNKDNDQYQIIRCITYKGKVFEKKKGGSGIHIIKNGIYQEIKGKKDIQQEIQRIVGYSADLFINSVIYGQRIKRIIEAAGPDKKKLFDEAFETLFVDRAKGKALIKSQELKGLLVISDNNKESLEQSLEELKRTYKEMISFERSFKDLKKGNLNKTKTKIQSHRAQIEKIDQKIAAIQILKSKDIKDKISKKEKQVCKVLESLAKYKEMSKELEECYSSVKQSKSQYRTLKESKCFECGSTLKGEKLSKQKTKISIKIDNLLVQMNKLEVAISGIDFIYLDSEKEVLSKELKELQKKLSNIKSDKKLREELEYSRKNFKDTLKELKQEQEKIKNERLKIKSTTYQEKIEEKEAKLKVIERKARKIAKEKEIYDWLIKDPLSNSGLKAYIFNSLLSKVNHCLKNYSNILGFNIEFGIDMQTANKDFYQVIYQDNEIILYNDLSGGQKQLVDTSVALAIHDVISSVRPTNILFLDEPFEGLDNDTIELVSEIIQYKSSKQALFLITHHSSFNPTNAETLYFNLDKKGNTVIT